MHPSGLAWSEMTNVRGLQQLYMETFSSRLTTGGVARCHVDLSGRTAFWGAEVCTRFTCNKETYLSLPCPLMHVQPETQTLGDQEDTFS